MTVVDAHAHLGDSAVSDLSISFEDLLRAMQQNSIDAAIVLPHPIMQDFREAHNDIAAMAEKYPRQIFGIASLSPLVGEEAYLDEVNRCIEELDFVGLKYHPVLHGALPSSEITRVVFDAARSFEVPVIIHTGLGMPWSHPYQMMPLARDYPEVNIVFAHSGFVHHAREALLVAQDHQNVYLETSWTGPREIAHFVKELGAHRVMMGADGLLNMPVELAKYHAIPLSDESLKQCLGQTAIDVFQLPI